MAKFRVRIGPNGEGRSRVFEVDVPTKDDAATWGLRQLDKWGKDILAHYVKVQEIRTQKEPVKAQEK